MKIIAFVSFAVLSLGASAAGQPAVERWGTLREVLRLGQTEARVAVSELEKPGLYGLGAMEGLSGELVILDGQAWVARPDEAGGTTTRPATPSDRATFAVASVVESWTEHPLTGDLSGADLEQEVLRLAREQGFDAGTTFPFLVEGKFRELEAHVLAGACPFASEEPLPEDEAPRRIRKKRSRGVLVGFHSGEPAGVISHHDSALHVHVLLDGRQRVAAHLDSADVKAGAILKLPTR